MNGCHLRVPVTKRTNAAAAAMHEERLALPQAPAVKQIVPNREARLG